MSRVTSVVLAISISESRNDDDDDVPSVGSLNAWLAERGFPPLKRANEGGNKMAGLLVYFCGYNFFPATEFVARVHGQSWDSPEALVLLLEEEEEQVTAVVRMPGVRHRARPSA